MTLRQIVFINDKSRNVIFIFLLALTSALAVRPDSTITPLALTLSVLLIYSPFLFRPDPHQLRHLLLTGIAISLGSILPIVGASLDALSTPGGSLLALFITSGILSSVTLATVYVNSKFHRHSISPWARITFFPALWATVWCTISYINPVGHLATWSVTNSDAYSWIVPFLGPTSKDWIVGAWAVVVSETIGHWYIGFQTLDDETDLLSPEPTPGQTSYNTMKATRSLGLFLTFLTIPSFLFSSFPRPMSWSTFNTSTPLTVGCVLPPYRKYNHHVLTLDDYIAETRTIQATAKIVLWPEGAVSFRSVTERDDAFEKIRRMVIGPYVGVAFEEVIADSSDPTGMQSLTRTGLAIVSNSSEKPHQIYYKRHLVPFVESFRLRHTSSPPTIADLSLSRPNHVKWVDWGFSRPIPVTSSICLDFAIPSPFAELETRPAIILAPARTWDLTVGYAMWLQAKQRAEELGTMVLWCDGGDGGVSGVAGGGYSDIYQVGSGTFVRRIGVEYPFDTQKTLFARFGDSALIIFWLSLLGPSLFIRSRKNSGGLGRVVHSVIQSVRAGRRRGTAQPNLVDL